MAIKYSSIGGGLGTGFNVQISSKYSYATFTQAQPAGSYTIKSAGNYTNWDVYVLDATNNLVAYTGGAALSAPSAFSAIVVLNGTNNDILQFSFQSTVTATAETTQTTAGPFITAATPTSLPNVNNTTTVTGGNFAIGVTATFTGTDLVGRTAKGIVRNSATSLTITRPDNMPVSAAPYTLTLGNPGINNPTNSNVHTYSGFTVGVVPVWVTGTTLSTVSGGTPYSVTLSATDADGGSTVTYSYVSGSLPSGLSFNSSTGVISGTYNALSADGSVTYTVRATDSGGNTTDRTFTLPYTSVSGGTLTSDATYYYRTFTSNGTLGIPATLTADVLMVAGGGGGGSSFGGGGGAGGVLATSSYSISAGSYTIAVGGGAPRSAAADSTRGSNGNNTTGFGVTCYGGGGGGSYNNAYTGLPGGSGGGGGSSETSGTMAGGAATQTTQSPFTGYGNRGGNSFGRNPYIGTGGGGAGAQGQDISSGTVSGNGGNGLNTWSSWAPVSALGQSGYIAGGGAGAAYTWSNGSSVGNPGLGGGGTSTGGQSALGGNAAANTGSGGGGGGFPTGQGGTGADGIVIVRYTRAQVGG
jgi:hypothetical protein